MSCVANSIFKTGIRTFFPSVNQTIPFLLRRVTLYEKHNILLELNFILKWFVAREFLCFFRELSYLTSLRATKERVPSSLGDIKIEIV